MGHRGFTLAEVLAITGSLVALSPIAPVLLAVRGDRVMERSTNTGGQQIILGSIMYMGDYDTRFPFYAGDQLHPQRENVPLPIDRAIEPYVVNARAFHSPKDAVRRVPFHTVPSVWFREEDRGIPRSFLYVSTINTRSGSGMDRNTGMTWNPQGTFGYQGRLLEEIENHPETAVWVEAWPSDQRSAFLGGLPEQILMGCDTRKLAGRDRYLISAGAVPPGCTRAYRRPATWGHAGRGHVLFVDGSTKALSWNEVRRDDFEIFRIKKSKP